MRGALRVAHQGLTQAHPAFGAPGATSRMSSVGLSHRAASASEQK